MIVRQVRGPSPARGPGPGGSPKRLLPRRVAGDAGGPEALPRDSALQGGALEPMLAAKGVCGTGNPATRGSRLPIMRL
jgi:hypothetical protein